MPCRPLLAAALALSSLAAAAEPAPADALDAARAAAATHFHDAAERLAQANAAHGQAHAALRSCTNGRLQLQFSDSLQRLERSRKALEAGRRHAQAMRGALESTRRGIEGTRGDAGYRERLLTGYVQPLDQKLVPLLDSYTAGITAYDAVLKKYGDFCAQPAFTPAAGRAFVTDVGADIDALATKASQLETDASGAATAAAEHAPARVSRATRR